MWVARMAAPQAPFWCATLVSPYHGSPSFPAGIDYRNLLALGGTGRQEIPVCFAPADRLSRETKLVPPMLIDLSDPGEHELQKGTEPLSWTEAEGIATTALVHAKAPLQTIQSTQNTVVVTTWPLNMKDLEHVCTTAGARKLRWGLIIPVIHPLTTGSVPLTLVEMAASHGARFCASFTPELDPRAKNGVVEMTGLSENDAQYHILFDSNLDRICLETERHIAALAHERAMLDFVPPPSSEKSNWNAAAFLALAGDRMLRLGSNVESGWNLLRSSRIVAELNKPLTVIASAASLSIIEGIDETSARALSEWLEDRPGLYESVNAEWRVKRG